jgi:hypothetical protein
MTELPGGAELLVLGSVMRTNNPKATTIQAEPAAASLAQPAAGRVAGRAVLDRQAVGRALQV